MRHNRRAFARAGAMSITLSLSILAQSPQTSVPFRSGMAIVQTLHEGIAERESVVLLYDVSPNGIEYRWSSVEVWNDRDTIRDSYKTFVGSSDESHATRWREAFDKKDPLENPGYTRFTVSTDILAQLRSRGSSDFSILSVEAPTGGPIFPGHGVAVRWRGKLTRLGEERFPLLLNGQRITVSAVHAKGDFTARGKPWSPDFWILEDQSHPLILKIADDRRIFQTVKVNIEDIPALEGKLKTACRAELPGIYFEFNSAALNPASDKTIGGLADILSRHPDWSVTIEGHTDNIGSAASNQGLSERRAESVRSQLVSRFQTVATHLRSVGYGATRPREPNNTVEGRARNRRVELLRPCGGANQ